MSQTQEWIWREILVASKRVILTRLKLTPISIKAFKCPTIRPCLLKITETKIWLKLTNKKGFIIKTH